MRLGPVIAGFSVLMAFSAIAFVGCGPAICNMTGINQRNAEKESVQYASKLGLNIQGSECAKSDSDGDGYVSCSLALKQPDGQVRIEPVECAVWFTVNSGCRVQKPGSGRIR